MLLVRNHNTNLEDNDLVSFPLAISRHDTRCSPPNAVIMEILKSLIFFRRPDMPPGPARPSRFASRSKISSDMI